jgi:hypothetical protein
MTTESDTDSVVHDQELERAADDFLELIRTNMDNNLRLFTQLADEDPSRPVEIRDRNGWLVFSGTAAQLLAVAF